MHDCRNLQWESALTISATADNHIQIHLTILILRSHELLKYIMVETYLENNKEISWVLQNKDSINTLSNWSQLNTGITFVYCPRIVIAKIFSSQTHQIYYSGSNLQHSRASTFIIFIVLSVEITFSNCEPAQVKIIFFHFVKTCLQSVSSANGHILMVSTVHMLHCSDTNIHLQHSDTTEISTRKYFLC